MVRYFIKHKKVVLVAWLFFCVGIVCLSSYHSLALNPGIDGISYISIARYYADGDFASAINAYWSPLISWLAALMMKIGFSDKASFLFFNSLTACSILVYGTSLLWKWTKKNLFFTFLFSATTAPLLLGSVGQVTPDLQVVLWSMIFAHLLISTDFRAKHSVKKYLLFGLVGAIGYFIKLYTVPVFIVSISVWAALEVMTEGSSVQRIMAGLKKVLLIFIATSLIVAPWIILLSVKYDKLMIGSAFGVNTQGAFSANGAAPAFAEKLLQPPNEHAISFGEDRTIPKREAEAGGGFYLNRFIAGRIEAIPYLFNKLFDVWFFTPIVLLTIPVLWAFGTVKSKRDRSAIILTLISLVYLSGFVIIETRESGGGNARYHWPEFILSLMAACLILPHLKAYVLKQKQTVRRLLFLALVLLLPLTSFINYGLGRGYALSIPVTNPLGIWPSSKGRDVLYNFDPEPDPIVVLLDKLKDDIPSGSKLVGDNYRKTVLLGYYLDAHVYGETAPDNYYNLRDEMQLKELRSNDIDYVIRFVPVDGRAANNKPLGTYGKVLKSYIHTMSCDDLRLTVVQACTLSIEQINKAR